MIKNGVYSKGADSHSYAMKRVRLISVAAVLLVCSLAFVGAAGADDVWDGTTDASWYDSSKTEFEISTAEQLAGLSELSGNGNNFNGKKIVLTDDIDLNGRTWTPIKIFMGYFDGGKHTISNYHIDATSGSAGFFLETSFGDGTSIKDLTLSDFTATVGNFYFGSLTSTGFAVHDNVVIKDFVITTTHTNAKIGGFIGWVEWGHIRNCVVENMTVNAQQGADLIGGFAAILKAEDWLQYNNMDVRDLTITVTDTDECSVGGLIGQTQTGWDYPKILNSDVTGLDITASGDVIVGGLIARPGSHTTIQNCHTEGNIDATGVTSPNYGVGGFLGNLGWNCELGNHAGHKVTGSSSDVDIITGGASAGGFVGSATNENNRCMGATFINCDAKGDVTNTNGVAGGFAGFSDRGIYEECSATGEVSGVFAGSFIGKILGISISHSGDSNHWNVADQNNEVDQIYLTSCSATGVVNGEVADSDNFIGVIDQNKPSGEIIYKYTISFDTGVDEIKISSIILKEGDTIVSPETSTLTKTGYTFKGWNPELPTTMPSNDMTVTAVWEGNSHTVSFDSDGGTPEPADTSVTYGSPYGDLPTVEKENYQFSHWKDESENKITSETLVETDNDHILTAVWIPLYNITVTVIPAEGGTASASSDQAVENSEITLSYTEYAGYKFVKWNVTEGNVDISDNKFTMPACDVTVEAVFEEIPAEEEIITPPSGGGSGGDGGALSFPRVTENGGLVDFGTSKVVKSLMLPEGSSGSVILKVDTIEGWTNILETEYTFDISVEKLGDGMAYILFEIPLRTLENLGITPADVCAYHFVDGEWVMLKTTYEVKEGTVFYEAATDSFSPFKLVFEEGAATPKAEETKPGIPPTEEPENKPEDSAPSIDESTKPLDEPETPAPLLAVLAGLGAAVVLRRK